MNRYFNFDHNYFLFLMKQCFTDHISCRTVFRNSNSPIKWNTKPTKTKLRFIMKVKFIIPAIIIGLTATTANATTLNLRHEYQDGKDNAKSQHKDRLLIDHRFDNGIGLCAEVKWANPKGEGFDIGEMHDAGHEVVVSYNYKVTDNFTLQPAYGADSNTNGITHKYNLKGTQKITDNWNVALRYRYGDVNKKTGAGEDTHYSQFNLTSGYKAGDFKFGLDVEYKIVQSASSGYKGDENYLNLVNVSAEYSGLESGWRPFAEFAMVAVDATDQEGKDAYAPRYRVGLKYSF